LSPGSALQYQYNFKSEFEQQSEIEFFNDLLGDLKM